MCYITGIGKACVELFVKNEYKVVIADRSVASGEALVEALKKNGSEAAFVELDISREESVNDMIAFTIATFGERIDCAVNCAGIGGPSLPGAPICLCNASVLIA